MINAKRFPLGVSNYRKLVTDNYYYVDKSKAIHEIIEDGSTVTVLTRPRRFGKTLFMSLLQHFFAADANGQTCSLFDDTAIKKNHPDIFKRHQGQYQVIFISFKDIKQDDFESALRKTKGLISALFLKHKQILESNALTATEKALFWTIANKTCTQEELQDSLLTLSTFLAKASNKPIIILIDEYDTPIISSYLNGYYKQLISFMRSFFSAGLKDNDHCYKTIITGIMRVAKESLFSGLNNARIYTVLSENYSNAFGFTASDVQALIQQAQLNVDINAISKWYNGYAIGHTQIFNPWSIMQTLSENGRLAPYWVNTSDNSLLVDTIAKSQSTFKTELQTLLTQASVIIRINEHMSLDHLENNDTALWGLLLFTGYLTGVVKEHKGLSTMVQVKIPNHEINLLFQDLINCWFTERLSDNLYQQLITDLTTGNVKRFTKILQKFLFRSMSYFDATGCEPERFYHGFVLGITASLQSSYTILSNRESGLGRYDLVAIPHDKSKLGIIFEFKSEENRLNLEKTAAKALKQINHNSYMTQLKQANLPKVLKLGMAFCDKHMAVCSDTELLSAVC